MNAVSAPPIVLLEDIDDTFIDTAWYFEESENRNGAKMFDSYSKCKITPDLAPTDSLRKEVIFLPTRFGSKGHFFISSFFQI